MPPITHIVLFQFSSSASEAEIKDVCTRMLSLSEKCLHPETKQQYVTSLGGGRDNSPEGLQGGLTHAFISLFQTTADRTYYLERDPVHLEFVASLGGENKVVEMVRVVDFENGVF